MPGQRTTKKISNGARNAVSKKFCCNSCGSSAQMPAHRVFGRYTNGHAKENAQVAEAVKRVGNVCWPCLERSDLFRNELSKEWVLFTELGLTLDPHARRFFSEPRSYVFAVPESCGTNFLVHFSWLEDYRRKRFDDITKALAVYSYDDLRPGAEAMARVFAEYNYEAYGWIGDRALRNELRKALLQPQQAYSREMLRKDPPAHVKVFNRVKSVSVCREVREIVALEELLGKRTWMIKEEFCHKATAHIIEIIKAFYDGEQEQSCITSRWIERRIKEREKARGTDVEQPQHWGEEEEEDHDEEEEEEEEEEEDEEDEESCDSHGHPAGIMRELKASPEYPKTVFDSYINSVMERLMSV